MAIRTTTPADSKPEYDLEEGPTPKYQVSKDLSNLTLMFIVSAIIYFLIAGSLAIVMRVIQANFPVMSDQTQNFGLFYAALTIHGQLMFFGFASMLTIGISYYLLSKFARKPLYSMNIAVWSFATMNAGAILLIISGTMFFGAGWYNLMPLPFIPGPGSIGWSMLSTTIFLIADAMIGVGLTLFSINVLATVLRGKIAAGKEETERNYDQGYRELIEEIDTETADELPQRELPAAVRWVSLLGISSWFPKRHRQATPAVSIVVVGVFVNALIQLIGNAGIFMQLANGFLFLTNPEFDANWLLVKDMWWFFGHPIVYFTLFSFLGAAYYYIPRYTHKVVPYDKWAYRPWPFYFIFTVLVFSHHLFMDMPNPTWLQMIAQTASFGIVFPSGLTIMTYMMYIFRSRIKWNVPTMFILAGVAGWAFGGFTGVQTGWWGTNVYLHNTLQVVGHIHLIILMGSVLLGIGLIYAIVPAIIQKRLNKTLGFIHLGLTLVGGFGLAFLFTVLGYEGVIRREAQLPNEFMWSMLWLLFFALTVGFGQIVFAYNLFKTIARKHNDADEPTLNQISVEKNPKSALREANQDMTQTDNIA